MASTKPTFSYFTGAFVFSLIGVAAGGAIGFLTKGTISSATSTAFIVAVLGIMEISLSFDNAVVNAKVLEGMSAVWRARFISWGIIIAVFGMRVVFPLLIVGVAARLNPVEAVRLAVMDPARYAEILTGAHVGIAAFGGSFLFMVAFRFFFDAEKDVHWIAFIEQRLTRFASIEGFAIGLVLLGIYGMSRLLGDDAMTFMVSGIFGLIAFIAVESIGSLLNADEESVNAAHRAGLASFVYLETLDASFSFDGVIGAFALSNSLFIIAIGLGIGAFYVRSMTLMLVERGTLATYRYLEHGAFWAILCLAAIMYLQTIVEIPEVVTGLLGAGLIGLAFWSSVRFNRAEAAAGEVPAPSLATSSGA